MALSGLRPAQLRAALDPAAAGREMRTFIADLYPICRSITGEGVRQTLRAVGAYIPLVQHEVPSGTSVLDWTVPREWNVRDAYVLNGRGERIIDFRRHTLHLVSYSVPVARRMSLRELRPHLYTLPEHPAWIPYRTSYYREDWGFCLAHQDLLRLEEGEYDVHIDTTLADGALTYGECVLPGRTAAEVLISCHVCHPSLCNDNLSGVAVATHLARALATVARRYTYRFLFIPGTIGSITWLARHRDSISAVRHGLVLAGVGDRGAITYKKSRRGDAEIDRAVQHVLTHSGAPFGVLDFWPYGYDERQYCSPGFDLPVGTFMRTPYGRYPEYHTSADDLDFVDAAALVGSLDTLLAVVEVLEGNATTVNLSPYGEPQLGRRGLYRGGEGGLQDDVAELALLWVLNLSDGRHSLLDIAERSGLPFDRIRAAADRLAAHDLLDVAQAPEGPGGATGSVDGRAR